MGELVQVLAHLRTKGLLLLQDKRWPSVVTFVVGQPISTSWWSHPHARRIWKALHTLSEHEDVLSTKLIAGKVTLVARFLWPALFGVGTGLEPWQTKGLSPEARRVLRMLDETGTVRASGQVPRLLAERLLALAQQVHTESGKHELVLETWQAVAKRVALPNWLAPEEGRRALADAAAAIGVEAQYLPWQERRRRSGQGLPIAPASRSRRELK